MDKEAFKTAFRNAARAAGQWANKHPRTAGALAIGSATGLAGAAGAATDKAFIKRYGTPKERQHLKKHPHLYSPLVRGGISGVIGAGMGAHMGHSFASAGRASHGASRVKDLGVPSWLKGVKTKKDAKTAFRAAARKHHPDLGGDAEKMKKLNQEWESFEKHHFHKLSMMVPGLFTELAEIYR